LAVSDSRLVVGIGFQNRVQVFLTTPVPEMDMVWVASMHISGNDIVDRDMATRQELLEHSRLAILIGVSEEQPYTATN
jgi:hypothetical protein